MYSTTRRVPASSIAPDGLKIVGRIGRTPLRVPMCTSPSVAYQVLLYVQSVSSR